jgi:uncharacterized protein (DUF983 family)
MSEDRDVSLKTAIRRALLGHCPACGEGKLFKSYLKQVENCAACGERLGHIRADDAAPWGTIILVGHVFLPLAFLVDVNFMPTWAAIAMWVSLFSLLSLAVLPRSKALFLAILWQTRAPGYQPVEIVHSGVSFN